MCFIIDNKHPKRKKADKNIPCYKVVKETDILNNYIAVFQGFIYKKDILYTGKMHKKNKKEIHVGFHSYSLLTLAIFEEIRLNTYSWYTDDHSNNVVVQCIIPKGAEYYYNSIDNQYVSNQIIIKEKIK